MANFSLDVSGAISTGWEYAKKYGLLIAVIYLLISIITEGLQGIFGGGIDQTAIQEAQRQMQSGDTQAALQAIQAMSGGARYAGSFIGWVIETVVAVGLFNLALGLMNGRFNEVTFEAFKLPFATYLKVFVVDFLTSIIMGISLCLCVIPFFFVAPRLVLAPVYQVEHPEAGIIESISASWNMTKDNTLGMLGLGFAIFGILIVGLLCCCIGVFFAEAIVLFITVGAYYQLKGNVE